MDLVFTKTKIIIITKMKNIMDLNITNDYHQFKKRKENEFMFYKQHT